ncbi:matrix-remodeling-associated protein 7 isoform X3 [Scophthalmus maximus]|uniref:matrix-remodeling-associated protein 7 isoform X3 n=1 Tax=Scophthalmus maximus TaxID=52904 RepID=UPI001FA908A6|nr:matrix-remodeling-associated protein 7 isoform X3 [Scophthalmus maximus]
MDLTLALSAVIFTLLAIVVATSLFGGSSPVADFAHARGYFAQRGLDEPGPKQNGHAPEEKEAAATTTTATMMKKKRTKKAAEEGDWCEISGSSHDHWDVVKSVLSTEGAAESPEVNDNALKYVPGKSRSHHLQMMMSKEELEEEQRVQREQLAAIFQLLSDNKETFGETSEGDMEEQLRLYSI